MSEAVMPQRQEVPLVLHKKPIRSVVFVCAVIGYSVVMSAAAFLLIPRAAIVGDPGWGMDYQVYLRAARELWTSTLYENRPTLPFIYPPIAALMLAPLQFVPDLIGQYLLNVLTVAATVTIVYSVLSWYKVGNLNQRRLLSLAATTMFSVATSWRTELALGQINSILLALIIVGVTRVGDRLRDGALVGVSIAIKLAGGIVVPALLLVRRWRAASGAILTFLLSVVIGLLVLRETAIQYWVDVLPRISAGRPRAEIFSQNLKGALPRFGLTADGVQLAGILGWVLLAALTATGLYIAYRKRDHVKAVIVLGLAGLLAQPVTWTHHWVWLGPAALVLLVGVIRSHHKWRWAACLIALLATIWFPMGYAMPGQSLSGTGLSPGQALLASNYVILGLALLVLIPLCPTARTTGASPIAHQSKSER